MNRISAILTSVLLIGAITTVGSAAVVLSSNFDGHTSTDGATSFTGIGWTVDGISTPSSTISYFEEGYVELDGAPENADRLAVQPDLTGEFWFFFIEFTVFTDMTIDFITLDYQFLNADGTNATEPHPDGAVLNGGIHDFSTGGVGPIIGGSGFGLPLGTDDPADNSGSVLVEITGTYLYAGQNYGIRLGVAPGAIADGHRFAIDNLTYHTGAVTAVDESNSALRPELRLSDAISSGVRVELALPDFSESIDLAVFDIMGRRVDRLYLGDLAEGRHGFTWNGTDSNSGRPAAQGVYFIRARVGDDRLVKRYTILR